MVVTPIDVRILKDYGIFLLRIWVFLAFGGALMG